MKILKEKSREYKGKSYFKYKVNIPEDKLKKANLNEGDNLEIEVSNNKIILSKIN